MGEIGLLVLIKFLLLSDSACEAHRGSTRPCFRRRMPTQITLQVIASNSPLIWIFASEDHRHSTTNDQQSESKSLAFLPAQVLARPLWLGFASGMCILVRIRRAVRRSARSSAGIPCIFLRHQLLILMHRCNTNLGGTLVGFSVDNMGVYVIYSREK